MLTEEQRSEIGRALSALRQTRAGGRSKKMRKCSACGQKMGARDMQKHPPRCPARSAQ